MKKELFHFKDFSFFLRMDKELSRKEKCEIHELAVRLFPLFKDLYDEHGYYSTVKPQISFLIRKENELIGAGKLLWRNVKVENENIKLFAFGMLIDDLYQGKGIGTEMIDLNKKEAGKRKADLLYGSTNSQIMWKMLIKSGFKRIKVPITYKDSTTKEIKKGDNYVYLFEFKKGLINKVNKLKAFYVGIGPI